MSETDPRKIAQESLSQALALVELVAHYDPVSAAAVREHITALAAPVGGTVPVAAELNMSPRNVMNAVAHTWAAGALALWTFEANARPDVPSDSMRAAQCVLSLRALSVAVIANTPPLVRGLAPDEF